MVQGGRQMTRTHQSVIVYGEELTLPVASMERFFAFERWLAEGLATLEVRWTRRVESPESRVEKGSRVQSRESRARVGFFRL